MRPRSGRVWYARREGFDPILRGKGIRHGTLAGEVGVSRSYWSQILNGKRPAPREVRERIGRHHLFRRVKRDVLWRFEVVSPRGTRPVLHVAPPVVLEAPGEPVDDAGRAA